MAKYAYRCMKCRARNMFHRRVEHYKIARKCKACGYSKFYWDKARNLRPYIERPAETCYCSSPVYSHPHRPGAKFCEKNPQFEFNLRTLWAKETPEAVRLDMALEGRGAIMSDEAAF